MTSVAVSSLPHSDASFPYPHSAHLHHEHRLPSIRSVFEGGSDAPGIVSNQPGSQRNTNATCDEEEDEALPLLISMSGGSGSAASTLSKLPAVSSILPETLSANQNELIIPGASSFTCEQQQQQLSLHKQKQTEVERTASPTASPSSSPIPSSLSSSSSSSPPWLSPPSRSTPTDASTDYDSAVTAAASRLMELSDLTPVSQQRDSASFADDRTFESRAKSPTTTTTTTRCPRPGVRRQQKIEKVCEAIERERLRAQRLRQQLQAVLREREELLNNGDSSQGTNPLPSFATTFAGTQAENRGTSDMGSSALLPPITSVPALSPYLKQQSSFASPACAPRCLFAGGEGERSNGLCFKRAREDDGDSDDDEYQPNKEVKRSRSFSEGGQRLQSITYNKKSSFGQGSSNSDTLAFIGRRQRANSEGHVRFAPRRDAAKKPGVLCFMKDHPHASFWLARSNLRN